VRKGRGKAKGEGGEPWAQARQPPATLEVMYPVSPLPSHSDPIADADADINIDDSGGDEDNMPPP